MPLIESLQKQILFDEAAKKGLVAGQLFSVGEIYENLLGPTDIGQYLYGNPLAGVYVAKAGYEIDVTRIASFFKGLARDLKVVSYANQTLEDQLLLISLEFWIKSQLLKTKAIDIQKRAEQEKFRAVYNALWVFTETFNTVDYLDLARTTADFDSSEGIAFIPSAITSQPLKQYNITVTNLTLPTGGNTLGSTPMMAVDGLLNTNFRCLFVDQTKCSFILNFDSSYSLGAITIDPVGFGINLMVEAYVDNSWQKVATQGIFNKTSLPIDVATAKIRLSFNIADSVLPKTGGIREITFTSTSSSDRASVYSKKLTPSEVFKEVKIDYNSQTTAAGSLNFYYSTASGGPWNKVYDGTWSSVGESNSIYKQVLIENSSRSERFRGLYGINVGNFSVSPKEGKLEVGKNQVEVTAVRQDWLETGDSSRILNLTDFEQGRLMKAWSNVPTLDISPSSYIFQNYGAGTLSTAGISRGSSNFLFQRSTAPGSSTIAGSTLSKYKRLCIVPLTGTGNNICQYSHSYRIKFYVYAPNAIFFKDGRIWFLQGFKATNTKPYKEIGRVAGTYSMYINDVLAAADNQPYTIFQDNTLETGAEVGRPYSLTLVEGWNKVEIFINTVDPQIYGSDSFDSVSPYLQLEIFPSLFDESFAQETATNITNILASGEKKPVNEFDLLWNLPEDPTFWAWSEDRSAVLFNINKVRSIDSYFTGASPNSYVNYRMLDNSSDISDLYIRADLERGITSSPILSDYTVFVR
jgi:hypothetical protein